MRENLGAKSFQQALIPNELEIICKVSGGIYTPGGYRGRGYALVV
jgi:predicted GNAT family acetyltransferase